MKPKTSLFDVLSHEVDTVISNAASATFYGGYAGYFQDPDQHLWKVAWNLNWILPD